jgi:benzylsuccinate CoA-transferase BbsE subunit/naphthyl-2-methylsuccinate CoA transferase subunit
MNMNMNNFFANIRVLELAGGLGAYTGKLFADLGAEVIRIESLDGDPTRNENPFIDDVPGLENSLRYQYLNTNKKGIVVDITKPKGKEILLKLGETANLLIEGYPPGYMAELDLGYEQLSAINPKLVHTAISPYGQYGPYRDFPYADITCLAMGGMLYLAEIEDKKPAQVPDKQAYFQGDLFAALGSIMALYNADITGEGQFIDVSLQESVVTALENAIQTYDLEGIIRRASGSVEAGYGTYRCKDGYVYMMAAMGRNTYLWKPLVDWLIEEKIPDAEILASESWQEPTYRRRAENKEIFKRIFENFSLMYTKYELYEGSQKRRVVIYPVNNAKDVIENPQLKIRNYFQEIKHESLNRNLFYPGKPYSLEKITWELRTPAPIFGQHTEEVLFNCGYSKAQIKGLRKGGVIYGK